MNRKRVGWRSARFVVVDLETTGLDPVSDEIIAFAAVPVRDGRIVVARSVMTLLRPEMAPHPDGIRIHGLRAVDLQRQPTLVERLDLISDTLAGAILVAHCASIETRFLAAAFTRAERSLENQVIDTMTLGRAVLRASGMGCPETPSLGFLAHTLNLPVHRPHHADGDALTTAQVFLALASHLGAGSEATLAELVRASRAPHWLLSGLRRRVARSHLPDIRQSPTWRPAQ